MICALHNNALGTLAMSNAREATPEAGISGASREEFEKNGYVIIQNLFSREEMAALIEDIKTARTRNGVSGLNQGSMTFYSSLFFHNPRIREFVSQPKIIEQLVPLIGPDFWVRWDQAVAKGPGSPTFAGTRTTATASWTTLIISSGSP